MISTKDKKALITQSNSLIEQPYQLTSKEHILIRFLISKIQPNDSEFKVYRFKISDYMKLLGIKNGKEYSNIKIITQDLLNKGFTIQKPNGILQVNWLASAEYFDKEGTVEVEFSSKLKPYLLQLKESFTSYSLESVYKFRCQYTFKMFDILKQYANTKHKTRKFLIEELRNYLCIQENEYIEYRDFKRRTILPAIKEINQYTEILIDMEEYTVRKKVEAIEFKIQLKSKIVEFSNIDIINEIIEIIKNKTNNVVILAPKTIIKLVQEKGEEKVRHYAENADKFNYDKAINPSGLFIDAVMNEYKITSIVKKKQSYAPQSMNYEQRSLDDMDFDKLYENV